MTPAQSFAEVTTQLSQDPLPVSDPRYADLSKARATKELTKLRVFLERSAGIPHAYVKAAFVGHRGGGKSTFLLRLEEQLFRDRLFTPVHLYLDASLEGDCDYTDLLLWLVDSLVQEFVKNDIPLELDRVREINDWFGERTRETEAETKVESAMEGSVEAKAKYGIYWFAVSALVRLKSKFIGSKTHRDKVRTTLQAYSSDLLDRVNAFLDHAHDQLAAHGFPRRLLIVQDNLDRLRSEDARRRVFFEGGELLTSLRADVIYTAPMSLQLAPNSLSEVFGNIFTMSMVKTHLRNDKPHREGIAGLVELIDKRMAIAHVFESEKVARFLAQMSGGSVRDLIRLLSDAQLDAQVDGKTRIDMASAREAVLKLRLGFMRSLVPGQVYYPMLAEIHRTKREFMPDAEGATPDRVRNARQFFAELVHRGVVLEYNGDDQWYDVHPAACEIPDFKSACLPPQS